jgi:hypothetical protein
MTVREEEAMRTYHLQYAAGVLWTSRNARIALSGAAMSLASAGYRFARQILEPSTLHGATCQSKTVF